MIKVKELLNNFEIHTSNNLISNPEISVILPTFCRGDNGLLKRAIDSVLEQTFNNFELIIVDDCSIDSTQDIVKKCLDHDNRLVYIRNNINSGLPAIRVNQGIMHARGKYIAYQFDDDQWVEKTLEILYNEICRHKEDCVVYGKGLFVNLKTNTEMYLGAEIEYPKLLENNRIINNSVLHPKSLCYDYGTYDCHLVMRRPCDWDLWLRWMNKIPFVFVDEVVSVAEAFHENSLGHICLWDPQLFRIYYAQDRTEALKLNNIEEYCIDSLDFLTDENYRNEVRQKHIIPWIVNRQDKMNFNEADLPTKDIKYILVSKYAYDATLEIMLKNYIEVLPNKFRMIFVPEIQLNIEALKNVDIVILCRTLSKQTNGFLDICKKEGIPTAYAIDDDLLNLYKIGTEFDDLKPGTILYENLCYQLTNVDYVISYSKYITHSILPLNKNVIELDTNILTKYLENTKKDKYDKPFRIAFWGGDARKAEFDFIWEDILEISNKYGNQVEFYFWGYKPPQIDLIKNSEVFYSEFTLNYQKYLSRLSKSYFDLLLCPLFEDDIRKGKSPIKFLESAVCGAIGIYSDVSTYEVIVDGVTGFKIKNEKGLWKNKIEEIISMKTDDRNKIHKNAISYIKNHYTTEVLAYKFEDAIRTIYLKKKYIALCIKTTKMNSNKLTLSKPIKNRIAYDILIPNNIFSRIGFIFKTYDKKCRGNLHLIIKNEKEIFAETNIDLAYLSDNSQFFVDTGLIMNCKDEILTIEFTFTYQDNTSPISIYENDVNKGLFYPFKQHIKKTDVLYVEFFKNDGGYYYE